MRTIQRIVKNTVVLTAANIISRLFSFFFIIYVARYLGVEDFGILSFATAFAGIFAIFMDFGLNELTVREVARDKNQAGKYLGNFLILKIFLAVITFIVIALTINLLNYSNQTVAVVYVITLSFIFSSFNGLSYAIFRSFEKMEYQSIGVFLNSSILFLSGLMAISFEFSVIGFAFVYLFASTIVFFYSFALCNWKFTRPKLEIDRSFWWLSFREAWPIGVTTVCIILNFRLDTVMLSIMKDETAVGFYSAAYRITEATTIIAAMFVTAIFPVLSRYHEENRELFIDMYGRAMKYLSIVAFPMAFTLTVLAKPTISLFYGVDYVESVNAFQILIWAAAIMYLSMIISSICISANKQMLLMKIGVTSVVLNFILNLVLIPGHSFKGASIATVISQLYGVLVGIFFLHEYGYKVKLSRTYLPIIASCCATLVMALILIMMGIDMYIMLAIVLPGYMLLAFLVGFGEEDKKIVKDIFDLSRGKEKRG